MDITGTRGIDAPRAPDDDAHFEALVATGSPRVPAAGPGSSNPAKDPALAHYVYAKDSEPDDPMRFRKVSDLAHEGKPSAYGDEPVSLPSSPKHQYFRSSQPGLEEFRAVTIDEVEALHPYQVSHGQLIKFVAFGNREGGHPLGTGTSRPNVVCMTDGMTICTGVAIAGVSRDAQKAKAKVYHIWAGNNPHALEDIDAYLTKMKSQGIDEIQVAMHGGGKKYYSALSRSYAEELEQERILTEQLRSTWSKSTARKSNGTKWLTVAARNTMRSER
jgi:hypothetical protein